MDRSCFRWSWYSPRLPLSKDDRSDCEEELGKKGSGGQSFSFRTLSGLRGWERVLRKIWTRKSIQAFHNYKIRSIDCYSQKTNEATEILHEKMQVQHQETYTGDEVEFFWRADGRSKKS